MKRLSVTRRQLMSTMAGLAVAAASAGALSAGAFAAGGAKGKTVEYITFGLQFEYQVAMVEGIKKKAAEAGVNLHVIDGKGDPNLQVTAILDAVTKKPDALLINPIDATLVVAGVKRANEANIPVFIMENAPPEGKYLSFVDFDNVAGGSMGADALAKLVSEKGTVLETRGSTGSAQAEARHKGFLEGIGKYPNIKVKSLNTEWVADNAYKMTLDALTQDPNVVGVFSHNDEMIRGVVSALRQTGKLGQVKIVGLDGTPLALQRIREGTQDATVEQSPYAMGGAIFDAILAYFDGQTVNPSARTKPTLIDKSNVDDPFHWGNAKK